MRSTAPIAVVRPGEVAPARADAPRRQRRGSGRARRPRARRCRPQARGSGAAGARRARTSAGQRRRRRGGAWRRGRRVEGARRPRVRARRDVDRRASRPSRRRDVRSGEADAEPRATISPATTERARPTMADAPKRRADVGELDVDDGRSSDAASVAPADRTAAIWRSPTHWIAIDAVRHRPPGRAPRRGCRERAAAPTPARRPAWRAWTPSGADRANTARQLSPVPRCGSRLGDGGRCAPAGSRRFARRRRTTLPLVDGAAAAAVVADDRRIEGRSATRRRRADPHASRPRRATRRFVKRRLAYESPFRYTGRKAPASHHHTQTRRSRSFRTRSSSVI